MKALVYKSTGSWYQVKDELGNAFRARILGKLKLDGITSTNPIAVGDWVEVEREGADFVIREIHKRHNYINRTSPQNRRQHHIVASNLDLSLLFATIIEPRTSLGFLDRFLVTCEAFHVPAIIVYNKMDLWKPKHFTAFDYIQTIYEKIGYKVLAISTKTGEGIDEVVAELNNKTTLLSGHSGVGKSSFINSVIPSSAIKTAEVSSWSGKGMHTTTFAEMYELPEGGRIIDTPGIRELGIADIEKEELSHYFPEMREVLQSCKFNNCQHLNEPGCAVKESVNQGEISEERYVSYLTLRDTIEDVSY